MASQTSKNMVDSPLVRMAMAMIPSVDAQKQSADRILQCAMFKQWHRRCGLMALSNASRSSPRVAVKGYIQTLEGALATVGDERDVWPCTDGNRHQACHLAVLAPPHATGRRWGPSTCCFNEIAWRLPRLWFERLSNSSSSRSGQSVDMASCRDVSSW